MVEYRILGSVEVYDRGWAVDLGGFRERTLLARLLVSANRTLPRWAGTRERGREAAASSAAVDHARRGAASEPAVRPGEGRSASRTRVMFRHEYHVCGA